MFFVMLLVQRLDRFNRFDVRLALVSPLCVRSWESSANACRRTRGNVGCSKEKGVVDVEHVGNVGVDAFLKRFWDWVVVLLLPP